MEPRYAPGSGPDYDCQWCGHPEHQRQCRSAIRAGKITAGRCACGLGDPPYRPRGVQVVFEPIVRPHIYAAHEHDMDGFTDEELRALADVLGRTTQTLMQLGQYDLSAKVWRQYNRVRQVEKPRIARTNANEDQAIHGR